MASLGSLFGISCVGCGRGGEPACERCRSELKPAGPVALAGLDRAGAVWRHEGVARDLVLGLKLRRMRVYTGPLVEGLVNLVMRAGTEAEVVTWPPCSPTDKRGRGFDHAELLARAVAERVGLPARALLARVGRAADQTGLSGDDRRRNLLGVFASGKVTGPVLLVDDVVTTGATLQACAETLRAGGAARIEALVPCSAF